MRLPPVPYRSVLITGCSSGIGLATAHHLRTRGWRVLATARQEKDLTRLQQDGFEAIRMDLADERSVAAGAEDVLARLQGQLGAVVNNAGFGQAGAMEDITRTTLRYQFEVNVFGLQDLTNRMLPALRRAGSGRIIHISSVLGRMVLPMYGSYCASKYAVEALADAQRVELRGTGIGVILVEPGPIDTEFRRTAAHKVSEAFAAVPTEYQEYYAHEVARRRTATKPASAFALPPSAVARTIERALVARQPRARYTVTLPARLAPLLKKFLPDGLMDAALATRVPPRKPATNRGLRAPADPTPSACCTRSIGRDTAGRPG